MLKGKLAVTEVDTNHGRGLSSFTKEPASEADIPMSVTKEPIVCDEEPIV